MYKKANVKWREEKDGILIFCPKKARIFKLNSTASEIWKILDGKKIEEIASLIATSYNISDKEALKDVRECLDDLLSKELIIEYE